MNDRYGRNDRFNPRGNQASHDQGWQDRASHDYDNPRQPQQWQDETRSYGESIQHQRGNQMGGQHGGYGGNQGFRGRDDNDWTSTEPQGRSDYGSPRGGWQSGGMSDAGRRGSEYQGGYSPRGADYPSFTGNDFGGRDFSAGRGAYGSAYSGNYGRGYGQGDGYSGGYGGGGAGGREYMRSEGSRENRGFIERAGDAIANWFGDDDDSARDQRMDHRGRGPSGYTRSDERIKEDASDHLTHDPSIDASGITVSVENGEVTLSGTVSSRHAKRRAEDCVDHVSGVKHVQNNLRVQDRMSGSQSATSHSGAASGSAATGASTTKSGSSPTPR